VYSRQFAAVPDSVLHLGASGWVYINTFVLWDQETGSMWYPFPDEHVLRSVAGKNADRELPEIPSVRTTWKEWKAEHPDTKILYLP